MIERCVYMITGRHLNGPIDTDHLTFVGKYTHLDNSATDYEGNSDDV